MISEKPRGLTACVEEGKARSCISRCLTIWIMRTGRLLVCLRDSFHFQVGRRDLQERSRFGDERDELKLLQAVEMCRYHSGRNVVLNVTRKGGAIY